MKNGKNGTLLSKLNLAINFCDPDVLLCHDDELEGRRIAYIFYLVPPDWEIKDGGMCINYMHVWITIRIYAYSFLKCWLC